jgi:hypothetical protein
MPHSKKDKMGTALKKIPARKQMVAHDSRNSQYNEYSGKHITIGGPRKITFNPSCATLR